MGEREVVTEVMELVRQELRRFGVEIGLEEAKALLPRVVFVVRRVRSGWGRVLDEEFRLRPSGGSPPCSG